MCEPTGAIITKAKSTFSKPLYGAFEKAQPEPWKTLLIWPENLVSEHPSDQRFAAQLEIAMTNEELRQRLIGAAYANAKRFTWHAHVRKLAEVYAEVAAK